MHPLFQLLVFSTPLLTGWGTAALCPIGPGAGSSVSFRPPSAVFGVAWFILYLLLGYSWASALQRPDRQFSQTFARYAALVFLLCLWIVAYGCAGAKRWALLVIGAAAVATVEAWRYSGGPELFFLLAWLVFAAALNFQEIRNL